MPQPNPARRRQSESGGQARRRAGRQPRCCWSSSSSPGVSVSSTTPIPASWHRIGCAGAYEYEGVYHEVVFTCTACGEMKDVAMWVDPADPVNYVTAYASAVGERDTGFRALGYVLVVAGGAVVFVLSVGWRWWLSRHRVG